MTRWNRIKHSPENPHSALARQGLASGTPVRCPSCQTMTLLVHLEEGCFCGYRARRREMAVAAETTRVLGAHRTNELSEKEYRKQMKRFGRFVA